MIVTKEQQNCWTAYYIEKPEIMQVGLTELEAVKNLCETYASMHIGLLEQLHQINLGD